MKKILPIVFLLFSTLYLYSKNENDTVSITFAGDLMLHTSQLNAALKPDSDPSLSNSYDFSSYFKYTSNLFKNADYSVINMEFPVGTLPYMGYPSFSAPDEIIKESMKNGIDLFLCANNHMCDKRYAGLKSTIASYDKLWANYTGLYKNKADEKKNNPFLTEIRGIRVAFINFTYGTNGIPISKPFVINTMDSLAISKAVERARRAGAEIIIALPHWGVEYYTTSSYTQRKWRDYLLSLGVSVIIGSHPHVMEPIVVENEADNTSIKSLTVYSMGNYISNMSLPKTPMGTIITLKLTRDKDGKVIIAGYNSDWIWCSRAGKLEKNYTTILVNDFKDKRNLFIEKSDYDTMMNTYNVLKKILN
ncbi:MAG: CapA family protein [Bacteroidales bacterium]